MKCLSKGLAFIAMLLMNNHLSAQGNYPPLPFPSRYQSPSKEPGQIMLDGVVRKVSLFHGKSYDEADWHVYIELSGEDKTNLENYLTSRGLLSRADLTQIYCEIMSLDDYENIERSWSNLAGDEKFFSADFSIPLLLSKRGVDHLGWELGVFGTKFQGMNINYSDYSGLINGRVYLQGAYVNDREHQEYDWNTHKMYIKKVEIHPLDGLAFALNENGRVLQSKYGQSGWPKNYVRWRVAFFANSKYHRINGEEYMRKDRTTTFYLDLPSNGIAGQRTSGNLRFEVQQQQLWDGKNEVYYSGRGWRSFSRPEIVFDRSDRRMKLKVSATMKQADNYGGIVVVDYIITAKNPVIGH